MTANEPAAQNRQGAISLRRRLLGRGNWQAWALAILLSLLVALGAGLWWIDTTNGHRFLASRISAMETSSGLTVRVGAIDGSIWSRLVVHNIALNDPRGRFAEIPVAYLDWYPLAWASNRLDIDSLLVPLGRVLRKPELRKGPPQSSLLPKFDIRLGRLYVHRLELGAGVAGDAHVMRILGRGDVRNGRAVVSLVAGALDTRDMARLVLDSRPDDNRFDADVDVLAPDKGVFAQLSGLGRGFTARLAGEGDWQKWNGRAIIAMAGAPTSRIDIVKQEDRYRLAGAIAPQLTGSALVRQIGAPMIGIAAEVTLRGGVLDGEVRLQSRSGVVNLDGGVDLGRSRFDNLLITVDLARMAALAPRLRTDGLDLRARIDGPMAAATVDYLLAARRVGHGDLQVEMLRASGTAKLGDSTTVIPVDLSARRIVTGDNVADDALQDMSVRGILRLSNGVLTSGPVAVRSARIDGTAQLTADLGKGTNRIMFAGDARGLEVGGFGRVDTTANLTLSMGGAGGLALDGKVRADVRRLDNAFLRGLGEGLPGATGSIALGRDGRLRFEGLQISAPALRLTVSGYRGTDGLFHFTGNGTHRGYGPVEMTLDGKIDRPRIVAVLQRPLDTLGLAQVRLLLDPGAQGFAMTASGQSTLGPFSATGAVLLPAHSAAQIRIDRLAVSDMLSTGTLTPVGGGLAGRLAVSGSVAGGIDFGVVDGIQKIGLDLNFNGSLFAGTPPVYVGRGRMQADVLLKPGAITVNASTDLRGVRYGPAQIGRFAATARLVNGSGSVWASIAGRRARGLAMQARAEISPDRIGIISAGLLDRMPVRLIQPAVLTRTGDGWQLAPATLGYRNGTLRIGGRFSSASIHLDAALSRMPLGILDVINEDIGLGGVASGSAVYDAPRGGLPSGSLQLRVRGLSRAGLALGSKPVDAGINAVLDSNKAAVRAIAASGGAVIGQAQALLTPLRGDSLSQRLNGAPLRAQVRYRGDAGTLWRLSGVELFSLSGPVQINADLSGTLADPQIRGTVSADGASLQSPVTGMALSGLAAQGTFNASRLELTRIAARTRGNGSLAGTGTFSFSSERGIGMAIKAQLDHAIVLDRDDIGATVSGPIAIESDGAGGLISGDFDVLSSRFTLGRAAAVAEIPEMRLIEVNSRGEQIPSGRRAAPWRLAIKANAPNRLSVTGLGMQSEWSADLNIGGFVTAPALTGTATLIRGDYDFAGKRFALQEGRLRFDGSVPANPVLNVTATGDVANLNATIRISGTSARPQISFTSVPALPQDELLSRLLFGTSITNLSAPEALQLASAVAALQGKGGGLDPINAIRRATGLSRLRVLAADTTTGQKTSIAAGKSIGRSLYVELITDGQGYSATRMEYQITRWLSLLSTVSTVGRQSINARVSKDY